MSDGPDFWRCQECHHLVPWPLPKLTLVTEYTELHEWSDAPSEYFAQTTQWRICSECQAEARYHDLRHGRRITK